MLVESYIYFRVIDLVETYVYYEIIELLKDFIFVILIYVIFKDFWGLYSYRFYVYQKEFCIYQKVVFIMFIMNL